MKRCFISLPITGRKEDARDKCSAFEFLLERQFPDCKFVTPFKVAPENNMPASYYMGKDIAALMECDTVLACKDWENSKGCQCERFISKQYGIQWVEMHKFIEDEFINGGISRLSNINWGTLPLEETKIRQRLWVTITKKEHYLDTKPTYSNEFGMIGVICPIYDFSMKDELLTTTHRDICKIITTIMESIVEPTASYPFEVYIDYGTCATDGTSNKIIDIDDDVIKALILLLMRHYDNIDTVSIVRNGLREELYYRETQTIIINE